MEQIYLDYAATTPVDPAVVETMLRYLSVNGDFGNPASDTHTFGQRARTAVETAREILASLLSAHPDEIIWTSGATEASNLAIKGAVQGYRSGGAPHVVTSAIEHRATLDTCKFLQDHGVEVTFVMPDRSGTITPAAVIDALRPETRLVTLMHVNNETGTITDVVGIAEAVANHPALFHVDAAQSLGRLAIDTLRVPIDLISVSAHKIYGPKGIGALFASRRCVDTIAPQIHGGGQERGLRSGTLATHQIAGFGKAAELVSKTREDDGQHQAGLAGILLNEVQSAGEVHLNAQASQRVPGIMSLLVSGVESEALIVTAEGVAFSNGSACTSQEIEPSHVLTFIGLSEVAARQSIRLSVGRFTSELEVREAGRRLVEAIEDLRQIAAL